MNSNQQRAVTNFLKTFNGDKEYSFNFLVFLTLFLCVYYGIESNICTGDFLWNAVQEYSSNTKKAKGKRLCVFSLLFLHTFINEITLKKRDANLTACIASNYLMLTVNVGNGYTMELSVVTAMASKINWDNKSVKLCIRWIKRWAMQNNVTITARTPKPEVPNSKQINETTIIYQPADRPNDSR